jgi:hypothetical protein
VLMWHGAGRSVAPCPRVNPGLFERFRRRWAVSLHSANREPATGKGVGLGTGTITRECDRATFQSKTPSRSQPGVFHLSYRSILRTSSNRRDVMGFARVNRCSGHLV